MEIPVKNCFVGMSLTQTLECFQTSLTLNTGQTHAMIQIKPQKLVTYHTLLHANQICTISLRFLKLCNSTSQAGIVIITFSPAPAEVAGDCSMFVVLPLLLRHKSLLYTYQGQAYATYTRGSCLVQAISMKKP